MNCCCTHLCTTLTLPCRGFGEAIPELLGQYSVLSIFRHDLFACLGYRREDYRHAISC
jgi:hypothetical protein